MFKKFISYTILMFFGFNSLLQPALASYHLRVEQDEKGFFLINSEAFRNLEVSKVELKHGDKNVGSLLIYQGNVLLKGVEKLGYRISTLPKLNSFQVEETGELVIEDLVEAYSYLSLMTWGLCTLKKGFSVSEAEGKAIFKANRLELGGNSYAKGICLSDIQQLDLAKDSTLKSSILITEGVMNSLRIMGELQSTNTQVTLDNLYCEGKCDWGEGTLQVNNKVENTKDFLAENLRLTAKELDNSGQIKMSQAFLDVTQTTNTGQIDVVRSLKVKGAWGNHSSGKVTVGEHFQGKFSQYEDDGKTSVYGLASLKAEYGRLSGAFLARYGVIEFQDDLDIAESATFSIQDHLTLHSHKNLQFYGKVFLKHRPNWRPLFLSSELEELIRSIEPGVFLSANGDFTRRGHVMSENTSVHYYAGGEYDGEGCITRSGFFKQNNHTIKAARARLADTIYSHQNLHLQARFAELLGKREVKEFFTADTARLVQLIDDVNEANKTLIKGESAQLAGHCQGVVAIGANDVETKKTFEHEKGALQVQAKTADIDGSFKRSNLIVQADTTRIGAANFSESSVQAQGKNIKVARGIKGRATQIYLAGDNIEHEDGSSLQASGQVYEKAKHTLKLDDGAKVNGQNVTHEAGSLIWNAGTIEALNRYLADTKRYRNGTLGFLQWIAGYVFRQYRDQPILGLIKAKQAVIYADHWVWNGGKISADDGEINTWLNMNFGFLRGANSLKVNALLNLSMPVQSNNYINNGILNRFIPFPLGGVAIPDFSSLSGQTDFSSWISLALSTGSKFLPNKARVPVEGALLLTGLYRFSHLVRGYLAADNEGDEQNARRPSRLIKNAAEIFGIAAQAYSLGKQALHFCDEFKKVFKIDLSLSLLKCFMRQIAWAHYGFPEPDPNSSEAKKFYKKHHHKDMHKSEPLYKQWCAQYKEKESFLKFNSYLKGWKHKGKSIRAATFEDYQEFIKFKDQHKHNIRWAALPTYMKWLIFKGNRSHSSQDTDVKQGPNKPQIDPKSQPSEGNKDESPGLNDEPKQKSGNKSSGGKKNKTRKETKSDSSKNNVEDKPKSVGGTIDNDGDQTHAHFKSDIKGDMPGDIHESDDSNSPPYVNEPMDLHVKDDVWTKKDMLDLLFIMFDGDHREYGMSDPSFKKFVNRIFGDFYDESIFDFEVSEQPESLLTEDEISASLTSSKQKSSNDFKMPLIYSDGSKEARLLAAEIKKLERQKQGWVATLNDAKNSHGKKTNRQRKIDHAFRIIQEIDEELKKLKKQARRQAQIAQAIQQASSAKSPIQVDQKQQDSETKIQVKGETKQKVSGTAAKPDDADKSDKKVPNKPGSINDPNRIYKVKPLEGAALVNPDENDKTQEKFKNKTFSRFSVRGDGNCLFYALQAKRSALIPQIHQAGLGNSDLAKKIRNAFRNGVFDELNDYSDLSRQITEEEFTNFLKSFEKDGKDAPFDVALAYGLLAKKNVYVWQFQENKELSLRGATIDQSYHDYIHIGYIPDHYERLVLEGNADTQSNKEISYQIELLSKGKGKPDDIFLKPKKIDE